MEKNPKTFLQTPDMNRNKARSVSPSDQFSHPAVTHGNSIVSVLPPPHPLKGPHHFAYFHRKQLKRGWGKIKPNSFMSNPLGADVSEKNTQTFLSCTPVFSYK